MSREKPRARINRHPVASAALPSAQTSNEDSEQPMNIEKANLQLQMTMMCIETYVVQIGAWKHLGGLKEDTGGYARGQATSGVHLDIYYRRCPPCCAPTGQCGTPRTETKEQQLTPKKRCYNTHQSPNIPATLQGWAH